jgi:hypothetical protein
MSVYAGVGSMEIELFADPIIKEERLMALRGPHALRLILREFTGTNVYSGQRVLQIRIRAGGGAGTGTPLSSTPTFNKARIEALIPILERANQVALDCLKKNQIPKGNPGARSNLLVELFWLFALFSEQSLFKAKLPVEYGAEKIEVEVIYNKRRNDVHCVVRSIMLMNTAMPALMNCAQFEIFKDRVVEMAQEL